MASLTLLRDVEVEGRITQVLISDGAVVSVGERPNAPVDTIVDGRGGALLPGLHDHHIHLLALAAASGSVRCGPPEVTDAESLRTTLGLASATLPQRAWIRGIGYHESVAGVLSRDFLDRLVPDRPLRIQHRSGALWMLNSSGLSALDLPADASEGIDRELGHLWRRDDLLHGILGEGPDLARVRRDLEAFGITGVTDATPDLDAEAVSYLVDAARRSGLPTRVVLLGAPRDAELPGRWSVGPRKILLPEHALPSFDDLAEQITKAHRAGRPVAVHSVTRASLLLTIAALQAVGSYDGDRIEHAAIVPREVHDSLAVLGVSVVNQPSFLRTRGQHYYDGVDQVDRDLLLPWASLLKSGIRVAPSSDAPYGDLDPWRGMRDAHARRTEAGRTLGWDERVEVAVALSGYLSPLDDPGGKPRRVKPGVPADLCLLHVPLAQAVATPSREHVRRVWHAPPDGPVAGPGASA